MCLDDSGWWVKACCADQPSLPRLALPTASCCGSLTRTSRQTHNRVAVDSIADVIKPLHRNMRVVGMFKAKGHFRDMFCCFGASATAHWLDHNGFIVIGKHPKTD